MADGKIPDKSVAVTDCALCKYSIHNPSKKRSSSYSFQNPVEPTTWFNVRDASIPKSDCIQKNSLLSGAPVSGSEDCLYLNLYRPLRPATQSNVLLPVIVYIHGGAFFSGSPHPALLGPQYFMNTGQVIFVAMAYRLGAFGFLSTGDKYSPGNYGLKDQTMALRWVQRNVRRFGGNPLSVTIMGVSAGAASVHMHMMSPLSKGEFNERQITHVSFWKSDIVTFVRISI